MITNKYGRLAEAFMYLMVISAGLHLAILFAYFVKTFDTTPFNFFHIIGLDIFFPYFVVSPLGYYGSLIVSAAIFIASYVFLTKRK